MKKIILNSLIVLLSIASYAQYQPRLISTDSLLTLFKQTDNVFKVYNELYYIDWNFKELYQDTALKPYLMQLLDREISFNYQIWKEAKNYATKEEAIKRDIAYKLRKQGRGQVIDSVFNSPHLYAQYKDSALKEREMHDRTSGAISRQRTPLALGFHSELAYPESYTIIRGLWSEKRSTDLNDALFLALLRMRDPEAERLFDSIINKFVQTNGESSSLVDIDNALNNLKNSYSIIKSLDVLSIDKNYIQLSEGDDGVPFKCVVIKWLLAAIEYNKIEEDDFIQESKFKPKNEKNGQIERCNYQIEHLQQIKEAAKKLAKKYDADNEYWMKNMPYNK